jgi:UDP-N-acetylglucosamine 2-epimerase (non-hydrolysing)
MLIMHIVGARPNFAKVAPVMDALDEYQEVHQVLVHTGQHYDANMSEVFFRQLGLPEPDLNLDVRSASHAVQTAKIMMRLEHELLAHRPDLVLVYGDVNSTVAAALVCAKLLIPTGHVEAGLRSFDRTMPEEINRLLTDQISDLLFTPSLDANENLRNEGIAPNKIHFVGNVMIDTLQRLLPDALARWNRLRSGSTAERYGLVTLHRPSNVDDTTTLARILTALDRIGNDLALIFPAHPRTRQRIAGSDLATLTEHMQFVQPLSYLDFLALQRHATLVITDSGGIQEETTYLGVPCLTIRENTERPVTITLGTNILVGQDMDRLQNEVARILRQDVKKGQIPPLWDGEASKRIASIVVELC